MLQDLRNKTDDITRSTVQKSVCVLSYLVSTVMIISFRVGISGQTVQTQIRLLLEEQSYQGLHCLQFIVYLYEAFLYGKISLIEF